MGCSIKCLAILLIIFNVIQFLGIAFQVFHAWGSFVCQEGQTNCPVGNTPRIFVIPLIAAFFLILIFYSFFKIFCYFKNQKNTFVSQAATISLISSILVMVVLLAEFIYGTDYFIEYNKSRDEKYDRFGFGDALFFLPLAYLYLPFTIVQFIVFVILKVFAYNATKNKDVEEDYYAKELRTYN